MLRIILNNQVNNHRLDKCLRQLLSEDGPEQDGPFELIRSRLGKHVYRVPDILENGSDMFAKVYCHKGSSRQFRAYLGKTGGGHDWRIANGLVNAGSFAPQPIGWACQGKSRLLPQKTVFAQQWVSNGISLNRLLKKKLKNDPMFADWMQQVGVSIGEFIGKVHGYGFWPRDFHPENLMVNVAGASDQGPIKPDNSFILIDYEAVEIKRNAASVAHLSLGHMASYLLTYASDIHIRFAEGYCRMNPAMEVKKVSLKILRIANEHKARRQKLTDTAFGQIAKERPKTPQQ